MQDLVRVMKFQSEKCGFCGTCVGVCPTGSLEIVERAATLNHTKCNDCGRCEIVCPLGAFKGDKT